MPNMDKEEPNRAKLRSEGISPGCMGSRADKQLSIRTLPTASEELPELAELRSNTTRPECAESSMDDMNSDRAMP